MRATMSNACTQPVLDTIGVLMGAAASNAKDERRFAMSSTLVELGEKREGEMDSLARAS